MIRGTTPTFQLKLISDSVDLTLAENVYATFKQKGKPITKTDDEIEVSATQVDVYLSQEETLSFCHGMVDIQLNWTYEDGQRACSKIVTILANRNLLERVLE